MDFRIADTFTDSLSRLTGEEQKAVKTTAFDLQINPANPGLSFHKLDAAKDKRFWSVRASSDIRLIVHKSDTSLLLCYVNHHDAAYAWATRRKLETHPKTGAAQLVEIREKVVEIVVPVYVQTTRTSTEKPQPEKLALFGGTSDDFLLGCGVPTEWLADVRVATEETLLTLCDHLPAEAAEALLEFATALTRFERTHAHPSNSVVALEISSDLGEHPSGDIPLFLQRGGEKVKSSDSAALQVPIETAGGGAPQKNKDPFEHPDAQRRFRVMSSIEDLKRALEFPWDKWAIFLHPEQRQLVERDYAGPTRVSGSAGTGKTIVALHRAAHLARANTNVRVLLTTFSDTLADALRTKLKRLLGNEPRLAERIDVYSLEAIGLRLYKAQVGSAKIAGPDVVRDVLKMAASAVPGHTFSLHFPQAEWEQVVDAWQLEGWEAYRDVARLGRKTRLPEAQRAVLWSIFEAVRAALRERELITTAQMFTALASAIASSKKVVFDYVVVDEAQDIGVAHARFLAALGGGRPNALFFAGDLGQRIFQQPFSWKSLGIDIRGRSRTLRINYRTSHQIRMQADRLLGPTVTDIDGNSEDRSDTVSVFNGPPPTVRSFKSEREEIDAVGAWLAEQVKARVLPHEFGVFVRSAAQLDRARDAVKASGMAFKVLDEHVETASGFVSVSTMHLAKGLEFRAVVVMACDDEIIPLQARIETVGDDADLQEVYETERHLLYVACTRARDHLLVTSVAPGSEFLDDMRVRG